MGVRVSTKEDLKSKEIPGPGAYSTDFNKKSSPSFTVGK